MIETDSFGGNPIKPAIAHILIPSFLSINLCTLPLFVHGRLSSVHNSSGDIMNNRQMLQIFLESLQCDQRFLRSILSNPMTDKLRKLINAQLKECANIENDATGISAARGWMICNWRPGIKTQGTFFSKVSILKPKYDHKIASALILYHTRRMISLLHHQNILQDQDSRISNLIQCYLDCLASTCHALQRFL